MLRKANEEDEIQFNKNCEDAKNAKIRCQEEADKLNLGMNILSAEYTLDRTKITFIYVADDRVDFRELLKVLASIFHCRIDLRQIGTRDKAKMVSGVGVCGRELCCAKFISEFDRITINMAKNQLLALNTQKLSGQCENLMCCLRFEDDNYKEIRKNLPKINSLVEYEGEKYKITSMNIIAWTCKLESHENAMFISLDDLIEKGKYQKNLKEEINISYSNQTKTNTKIQNELEMMSLSELIELKKLVDIHIKKNEEEKEGTAEEARKHLIRIGVLNEDGTRKAIDTTDENLRSFLRGYGVEDVDKYLEEIEITEGKTITQENESEKSNTENKKEYMKKLVVKKD